MLETFSENWELEYRWLAQPLWFEETWNLRLKWLKSTVLAFLKFSGLVPCMFLLQWMNKVIYKQQAKIRVNPTVGDSKREIFLPVWALNAAEIRYQNYIKSWTINATVAVYDIEKVWSL